MYHFAVADIHRYMVDTSSASVENQVARLHLEKLGAKLTALTDEQAAYINVPKEGPFKAENYRY